VQAILKISSNISMIQAADQIVEHLTDFITEAVLSCSNPVSLNLSSFGTLLQSISLLIRRIHNIIRIMQNQRNLADKKILD